MRKKVSASFDSIVMLREIVMYENICLVCLLDLTAETESKT